MQGGEGGGQKYAESGQIELQTIHLFLHFFRFSHFFLDIYLEKNELFVSNLFNLSNFVKNINNLRKLSSKWSFFNVFSIFYIFSWTYIWKKLNILSQITSISAISLKICRILGNWALNDHSFTFFTFFTFYYFVSNRKLKANQKEF